MISVNKLSVAISSCPNDTFTFYHFLHNPPEGIEWEPYFLDIQELNEGALAGKYDIVKTSFLAAAKIQDKYTLMPSGSALGFGVGPILLSRSGEFPQEQPWRVAVPGQDTTAHLLFNFFMEHRFPEVRVEKQFMIFSDIMKSLEEGSFDLGVVIHEGRFVYKDQGLALMQDLGAFWEEVSNYPVPLAGIFRRKDMDSEVAQKIERHLEESVERGWKEKKNTVDYEAKMLPFIQHYSQELEPDVLESHIVTYVNEETKHLTQRGLAAIDFFYKQVEKMSAGNTTGARL